MIGGELLSEGGYGCIFRPEIGCDGKIIENSDYISKIQIYDKSAVKEIEIGKIIKEIKGYKNRYAPVLSNCFVNISELESLDNKCSIINRKGNNKFILLKILYIDGTDFLNFLIQQKNSKHILNNIINGYNHLLKSIQLLIENEIIHFDLKGDNIMFNKKMNLPVVIDFGLSVKIEKLNIQNLKKFFYVYSPDYYIWCLEIHYLSFLVNKEKTPNLFESKEMVETYISKNTALKNFSKDFQNRFLNLCMKQVLEYNKIDRIKCIKYLLKFWKTWDNYSLSVLYLKSIYYLNIGGYEKNNFISFFCEILLKNIHPNPNYRLSINETLKSFNGFLLDNNINKKKNFDNLNKLFLDNRDEISIKVQRDRKKINLITKKIEKFRV